MSKRFTPYFIWVIAALAVSFFSSNHAPHASQTNNGLTVAFMDIGQGDAILLTTPHRHHILIDGGPDSTVLTRLGEEMRFNERNFDLVIATHNHADHITGLDRVLTRYQAQKMWISGAVHTTNEYLTLLKLIKDKQIPTEVVWAGKQTTIDGVTLEVEHPLRSMAGERPVDQHDATIVTRVTYGNEHFLLTGDLNEGHEQAMLDAGRPLQAEVLKVPHHGSATGLLPAFLAAVSPKYAVIQVGAHNSFGHPAPSTLKKLADAAIPTLRNDQNGTVYATTNGDTLSVTPSR